MASYQINTTVTINEETGEVYICTPYDNGDVIMHVNGDEVYPVPSDTYEKVGKLLRRMVMGAATGNKRYNLVVGPH
jgi:hypothetical protein